MDERFLELAAEREQAQRDAAIQKAHDATQRPGQPYCDDCCEQIPQARRLANPSACRCIQCQEAFETMKKGYA